MKDLSNNTRELLECDNFNFVKCFKIRLKNQQILTFTENSGDIVIDNLVYKSSSGVDFNNVEQFTDITENSIFVIGFIDNDNISVQDIIIGKFDNAEIEIFLVEKNNLNGEKIYLSKGYFGDIQLIDNKFHVRIEGVLSLLKKTITEIYSPVCRACFCDGRCGLNRENYTFIGSVDEINSKTNFFSTALSNFEKNYFKYGIVSFVGDDANQRIEVLESSEGIIVMKNSPRLDINVGDSFEILAGCDKTIETCAAKFNNNVNFRGEADIPRTGKIYKFY
jgi:uncharacterized phage protein (TIGR02218 family)